MSKTPDESPLSLITDYSKIWHDIWSAVVEKTQEDMLIFFQQHPDAHSRFQAQQNPVFAPEVVTETLSEVIPKIMEHPEKFIELQKQHLYNVRQIWKNVLIQLRGYQMSPLMEVESRDKRFSNPLWKDNPVFFFMQQIYLLNAKLLKEMVSQIDGLDDKTQHKLDFYTRHLIDFLSPTNFPLTNPDVLEETFTTQGENLVQGFRNFLKHIISDEINIPMTDMEAFRLGENLATTPGKIVYRNDLFELIQYLPTTEKVASLPLLIIPPWINKYYIFDLRSENSFIKWAVDSGLTVFIISWVNPDHKHAHKTITDYAMEGAKTAMERVCALTKQSNLNVLGYCTGGILLNYVLCYLKANGKNMVRSATLVASPVNFKEAGDLLVFVCEQQLKKLEDHVDKKGYLEGNRMVQAFNLLRANDLIWSNYVNNYLMGKDPIPFDMLHWNCDAVRMPARMHTDYLRKMYLENRLMQPGGLKIMGVDVDLNKITTPMFIMGAIDDHIAPWRSVFPMMNFGGKNKKFVLAGSGHVAGVINHPSKNKYHYWTSNYLSKTAEDWLDHAEKVAGSWWPEWRRWLDTYAGEVISPPKISKRYILDDAPGSYVQASED